MLKGKAEIILEDSKSGKVLHHAVEENIVTNAVQNVISGALDRLVGTHNNTSQAKDIDRLYTLPDTIGKELFGGVMLFSKALTEDKTHVLPTGDEISSLVGYASYIEGVIEGSTTKGTYNAEESTFTDGEIKLVFNFDNAVANGDIASICLTSALGGKYGLKNNTAPGTVLPTQLLSLRIGDPFEHDTVHSFSSSYPANPIIYVDSIDEMYVDGDTLYYTSGAKLYKVSCSIANKKGVGLLTSFDQGKEGSLTPTEFDLSWGSTMRDFIPDAKLSCIWGVNTGKTTKESLVLTRLYGDNLTEEKTISMSNLITSLEEYGITDTRNPVSYLNEGCIILDDKIYFCVGDVNNSDQVTRPTKLRIYTIDFSGEVSYNDVSTEAIKMMFGESARGSNSGLSDVGTRFIYFLDSLYVMFSSPATGTKAIGLMVDTTNLGVKSDITLATPDKNPMSGYGTYWKTIGGIEAPWISCVNCTKGSRAVAFSIELFMCYLATINNLSEVVHKTEDSKLKVIYTLTEG